jgi:hypothetical protein
MGSPNGRFKECRVTAQGGGFNRLNPPSTSDNRERPSPRRKALAAQLILVGNAQYRWYEREP